MYTRKNAFKQGSGTNNHNFYFLPGPTCQTCGLAMR
jgi:hypothetical protein